MQDLIRAANQLFKSYNLSLYSKENLEMPFPIVNILYPLAVSVTLYGLHP